MHTAHHTTHAYTHNHVTTDETTHAFLACLPTGTLYVVLLKPHLRLELVGLALLLLFGELVDDAQPRRPPMERRRCDDAAARGVDMQW